MRTLLIELRAQLEEASAALSEVTVRRMFGSDAFFAGGSIFAAVSREGRIGLKLPEAQASEMRSMPGADGWKIGEMVMRQWVLVPERFHDDPESLAGWVARAHAAALARARSKPPAKLPRRRPIKPKKGSRRSRVRR